MLRGRRDMQGELGGTTVDPDTCGMTGTTRPGPRFCSVGGQKLF